MLCYKTAILEEISSLPTPQMCFWTMELSKPLRSFHHSRPQPVFFFRTACRKLSVICVWSFQILIEEETLKGNNKQVVKETNLIISAYHISQYQVDID